MEQTSSVLKTLTPREEKIIKMRFGFEDGSEHTLEQVGQTFAVTRERIRQIEAKALRKLRHPARSNKLRAFLELELARPALDHLHNYRASPKHSRPSRPIFTQLTRRVGTWQGSAGRRALLKELLQDNLPLFERDLQEQQRIWLASPTLTAPPPTPTDSDLVSFAAFRSWQTRTQGITEPEAELRQDRESRPDGAVGKSRSDANISLAVLAGEQKYTDIRGGLGARNG